MFAEGNQFLSTDQFYDSKPLKENNNSNQSMTKEKHKIKQFLTQLNQQHNSQDQGIQDYKIGGYHPVHIGQVLINRYVVIQKLGWGHFSTVWLCKDFKYNTYVAVKIQKSSPHYMEAAFDQVQILQKIEKMCASKQWENKSRDDTHVVGLLNAFIHKTFYGNHFCMVFQILRCNLLDVIKRYNYEGIPVKICQQITKQVLMGLDYLHRVCGVIHTDLKPQNVMLCLSKQQLRQIVEQGQLNSHQLFAERTKLFRQYLGYSSTNNKNDGNNHDDQQKIIQLQNKLKSENLSKNQKRNIKKKLKKQLSNLKQDKQSNIQNQGQANQRSQQQPAKTNQSNSSKINMLDIFDHQKGKIKINRGNKLKLPLKVKIADLGNACWKHHYFSTEIQTRQYRSPEVILGQTYNQTADIWSLACMVYQMLTGDLLFQPKNSQNWSKNHDHLAQIQELVGPFDLNYIARSPKRKKYFEKNGSMKKFPSLNHYSLATVLQLKNRFSKEHAQKISQFLKPMLIAEPQKRIKASQALNLPWLKLKSFQQPIKMSQFQHEEMKAEFCRNQAKFRQQILAKQNNQASGQDLNENKHDQQSQRKSRIKGQRFADIRYVDRSFTDLGYIGYSDGIDLDKLDRHRNWQFK